MSESYGTAPSPPQMQAFTRTSGFAVAALILGILSWLCFWVFAAIPAIICGIIAFVKINNSNGMLRGQGMAIAGLILGAISFALLPIVAAIAIPSVLRGRISANEASAVGSLRSICVAQERYQEAAYRDANGDGVGDYGTLAQLGAPAPGQPGFIDPVLARGLKQGYSFTAVPVDGTADVPPSYTCTATPIQQERTGFKSFFVDESGVIRFTRDGSTPTVASPPLPGRGDSIWLSESQDGSAPTAASPPLQ